MKNLVLLIAVATIFASCATIISGTTQSVSFNSTPSNAVIYDNGVQIGKTPLFANLSRKNNHAIVIELDGYQPYEIMIKKEFNAWYLGNILLGGIIGLVIDPITGAMYKLTPKQINAEFDGTNTSSLKKVENNIYIAISLNPIPDDWEYIGALEPI